MQFIHSVGQIQENQFSFYTVFYISSYSVIFQQSHRWKSTTETKGTHQSSSVCNCETLTCLTPRFGAWWLLVSGAIKPLENKKKIREDKELESDESEVWLGRWATKQPVHLLSHWLSKQETAAPAHQTPPSTLVPKKKKTKKNRLNYELILLPKAVIHSKSQGEKWCFSI